jgi:CheY-like chemotaxis protein
MTAALSLQVLVVDDNLAAAQDYADLIETATGLVVTATNDPVLAIEVVTRGSVAVVVLDQRMPAMSGVDLFRRLIASDPRLRAIMLTGEASSDEVGQALDAGFHGYLHKSSVRQLPDKVLHEFVSHRATVVAESANRPIILIRRVGVLRRAKISFRVARVSVVHAAIAVPESWRDVAVIQAGASERVTFSSQMSASAVIERSSQTVLRAKLGFSGKALSLLSSELGSELSEVTRRQETVSAETRFERERTLELPPEPQIPTVVHVRMRKIQTATDAALTRIDLLASCSCCSLQDVVSLDVYIPTGRLQLRHVDRLSTGEEQIHDLGPVDSL